METEMRIVKLAQFLADVNRQRVLDAEDEARIRRDFKSIHELEREIDADLIGIEDENLALIYGDE